MVDSNWMTLTELSEYLKCAEEDIQAMVNKKTIPFSMLVGSPRFFKQAIDEWLLGQANEPASETKFKLSEGVKFNEDLVEGVVRLSGIYVGHNNYIAKKRRYINFKTNRVLFQIHPSNPNIYDNSKCAELVLPRVDDEIPETKNLEEVKITDLYGYWRANVGWLDGDGSRHTYRPAKAFHITREMVTDNKHKAWKDVKALLDYAMNRIECNDNGLKYTSDSYLKFLRNCDEADLEELVEILTKGKDGGERCAEELTGSDLYKKYFPAGEHSKYWHLIAAELQKYGGHTWMNIARGGRGVTYYNIIRYACKKLKVTCSDGDTTEILEGKVLVKILEDSIQKMNHEQLKQLVKELNIPTQKLTKQGVTIALQVLIKKGGFSSYKIAVIVANAVSRALFKRGLSFTAGHTLTKSMAILAGPIGLSISALWVLFDIGAPASRVVIPAVIHVAYMRTKMNENI